MYRTMCVTALVLPLLLGGCDGKGAVSSEIDEQDFPAEWAAVWCDRQEECAAADFESSWSSTQECEDEKGDDAEFATDWGDLFCGSYDSSAASECLTTVQTMGCDDWANEEWRNECDRVYGC
jgi:hypothetical protein